MNFLNVVMGFFNLLIICRGREDKENARRDTERSFFTLSQKSFVIAHEINIVII